MTDPGGGYGWRSASTPYGRAADRAMRSNEDRRPPIAVLLLPEGLEEFVLRDQAEDLLTAPGVVAVEPARMSYGTYLRLPASVADGVAATQARRLRLPGRPRVIVIFHPLQYPLARGLIAHHPDAELWYWRWDRYDASHGTSRRRRERLEDLHLAAALRAEVNVVVSDTLAETARAEGVAPLLVPLAADSLPAPDPAGTVVAVALGQPGQRTDWALLRAVAAGMPELVLLLVGEWPAGEGEDYEACRAAPNLVWLGRRADEETARLIACADVGVLPCEDAALPYRVLRCAKLGRRTIAPGRADVRAWEHAVTVADGRGEWIAALRASAGARTQPDLELRAWALGLSAHEQNRPLWERLEAAGIESGRLGSERAGVPPAKSA
jgi:hypothetical protein